MTAAAEMPADIVEAADDLFHELRDLQGESSARKLILIQEALLSARQRGQWEDIHTAPRDGTKVLCFSPGNRNATYAEPRHPHFCVDEYRGEGRSGFYKMWPEAPYTHWQPLPAAPKGGAE